MKKRSLSILLLCCMVLTMLPAAAFAADGEAVVFPPETDGLCDHHPAHDEACGDTPPKTLSVAVNLAPTEYTLHYDANGGSGAPPSQSETSSEYQVSFLISDIIPTHDGHIFKWWAESPSGTGLKYLREEGYYQYCLVVNGQTNSKTLYAIWEAHTHIWGKWTSNGNGTHTRTCTSDSSHTETGSCTGGEATCTERAVCEICGTAYGNPLGHFFINDWHSDADNHWKECARCKATDEKSEHTWDSGTVTIRPTCTTAGEKTFTCSVCSARKSETMQALGHDFVSHNAKPATCTEKGWNAYYSERI